MPGSVLGFPKGLAGSTAESDVPRTPEEKEKRRINAPFSSDQGPEPRLRLVAAEGLEPPTSRV